MSYMLQTLLVHYTCISEVRDLMQISPEEATDLSSENIKDTASQGQSDDKSLSRRSSQDSAFGERKPGENMALLTLNLLYTNGFFLLV